MIIHSKGTKPYALNNTMYSFLFIIRTLFDLFCKNVHIKAFYADNKIHCNPRF